MPSIDLIAIFIAFIGSGALSGLIVGLITRKKMNSEIKVNEAEALNKFTEAADRMVATLSGRVDCLESEAEMDRKAREKLESELSDEREQRRKLARELLEAKDLITKLEQQNNSFRDWAERLVKQVIELGGKPTRLNTGPLNKRGAS